MANVSQSRRTAAKVAAFGDPSRRAIIEILSRVHSFSVADLARRLPAYARPVFIRISRELDATETFKQKKGDLAREGFDPAGIAEPLYMLEPKSGAYVALDPGAYAQVLNGTIRL